MKVQVTHTFTYDTNSKQFKSEFEEWMGDHTHTFESLKEFIIDRFINPNFDLGGATELEIVKL
jgi:hypothetical protein